MNGRLIEECGPAVISFIVAAAWYLAAPAFPDDPGGLLGASATLSAVFAGFLGVAQGLLLTIKDTKAYEVLREANLLNRLFAFLGQAIYGSVGLSVISVVGFFILPQTHHCLVSEARLYEASWAATATFSLTTYIRITGLMFKLLRQV